MISIMLVVDVVVSLLAKSLEAAGWICRVKARQAIQFREDRWMDLDEATMS